MLDRKVSFNFKSILLVLLLISFTLGLAYFTIIAYPKNIAIETHKNFQLGKPIYTQFELNSKTMQNLILMHIKKIPFYRDQNKFCGQILILEDKVELSYEDTKKHSSLDSLSEVFMEKDSLLKQCEKVCFEFTPTIFLNSSFCVSYDENLNISNIEKLISWINY